MNIVEFLEARIAEEEAVARESQQYEQDVYEAEGWFDCTRVLAECKAKRAIIALHKSVKWTLPDERSSWPLEYWHDSDGVVIVKEDGREVKRMTFQEYCEIRNLQPNPPDKELLALASVYADHSDYNPEWRHA